MKSSYNYVDKLLTFVKDTKVVQIFAKFSLYQLWYYGTSIVYLRFIVRFPLVLRASSETA